MSDFTVEAIKKVLLEYLDQNQNIARFIIDYMDDELSFLTRFFDDLCD